MILGQSDDDSLHNFCASHEHSRGMHIGAVNGPRSLVENHQTKLRTWKSVRHSRCTMSSTLLQTEHTGKCTLVKVFLFNWVQVFISCVWTRSHQTPSDTSSDETQQQCGASTVLESSHHPQAISEGHLRAQRHVAFITPL